MAGKTAQLQIRVSTSEKARLKRRAKAAGMDLSTYVLACALPDTSNAFHALVMQLSREDERKFGLAELNDLLSSCAPNEFVAMTDHVSVAGLSTLLQNYVAAMVEQAATQKRLTPPVWVSDVEPLREPYFAAPLKALRLHLLWSSPAPFKRRNIFIDSSVGARV